MLTRHDETTTPRRTTPEPESPQPVSRHGPVAQLLIAWSPLSAILVAYAAADWLDAGVDVTRPTEANRLGFSLHVTAPAQAEQRLFGGVPTVWLQHRLVDGSAHWYDAVAALVYATHFVAIPVVTGLVWFRLRDRFAAWLAAVLTFTVLGIGGYVVYPAAPPWLASQQGLLGGVQRLPDLGWDYLRLPAIGDLVSAGQAHSNPTAAVPSLHAGAALLVCLFLWPLAGRLGRAALAGYVLLMALALVYSGEHYVVDVVAGWATAAAAVTAGAVVRRRRRAHPRAAGGAAAPRGPTRGSRCEMSPEHVYVVAGACLLLAVVLPSTLRRVAVSPAMVLLLVGVLIGATPLTDGLEVDPADESTRVLIEHVTELTVLTALMGVGLSIDRPLDLLHPATWRRWSPTWRLLGLAMPVTVLAIALLGWAALGLGFGAALLLGAVLSPTDPVLASDVQVGGPGSGIDEDAPDDVPYAEDTTTVTEAGEVRFALTSEAGLNDGLAFPFVHGAVLVLAGGSVLEGTLTWLGWYVLAEVAIGVAVGVALGRLLGYLAFRGRSQPLRLAEQGEPLLALAALLTAYGVAELLHGYGFLAVFACAMALRAAEHRHDYHRAMHDVISRLERLLTLFVLLMLGIAFSSGLLTDLDLRGVVVAVLLIGVIRPAAAWASLAVLPRRDPLAGGLNQRGRGAVAFFGIRGVGSIYYLAWVTGETDVPHAAWLWSTVAFTIALSVVVHGIAATPAIRRLDDEPSGHAG